MRVRWLLFVVFCAIFLWLAYFLVHPVVTKDTHFDFPKGASVRFVAQKLDTNRLFFLLLAHLKGVTRDLKSGEYLIAAKTTPNQLLNQLYYGKVILHEFTIVPGWTFNKVIKNLNKNKYLTHKLKGLSDDKVMTLIGAQGQLPEGRFFPDTYKFARGTLDIKVMQQAYFMMADFLNRAWAKRSSAVTYSCPYKALIAASIIEKEAALAKERPVIAGIIIKRLQKRMYLQLDPTLIYGLGKTDLTLKDLKSDNPFNTYTHKGLPPSPICMPGASAILAALNPKMTDYLYFVAKGDGSHLFSATLKEHNIAVRKYQLGVKS